MNTEVKTNAQVEKPRGVTIYCHFSFKRPRGEEYGIFAVAFYRDFEGKKIITKKVRKYKLWENHQFITAIQSYEHALMTISELQGMMRAANINQVMLVTDNSTLAGWIEYPKKNKNYAKYMEQAVKPYRAGAYKEIVIGVGLCEPRKSEKSYKFCKEELVENDYIPESDKKDQSLGYKLQVAEYKSVLDIIAEDRATPEIVGMKHIGAGD